VPFVCVRNIYLTSALSLIFALKYAKRRKWNGKLESHFPPVAFSNSPLFRWWITFPPRHPASTTKNIIYPATGEFKLNINWRKSTLFHLTREHHWKTVDFQCKHSKWPAAGFKHASSYGYYVCFPISCWAQEC